MCKILLGGFSKSRIVVQLTVRVTKGGAALGTYDQDYI